MPNCAPLARIHVEYAVNAEMQRDGEREVEDCVVVELKAVDALLPVHQAQVLTYLKLTGHRLGLLINFNVSVIRQGIKRIVL